MAKKKLDPVVQCMNLFVSLGERDRAIMADFVKSQTATPRKKSTKKPEQQPALQDVSKAS